jgi:hypothetical protein
MPQHGESSVLMKNFSILSASTRQQSRTRPNPSPPIYFTARIGCIDTRQNNGVGNLKHVYSAPRDYYLEVTSNPCKFVAVNTNNPRVSVASLCFVCLPSVAFAFVPQLLGDPYQPALMESISESLEWLVAIQARGESIGSEIVVYVRENWWAMMLLCACLIGLSNVAIGARLHSLYTPVSLSWLCWAAFSAALPYLIVTAGWDEYSEEAAMWVTNAFRSLFVLACLLVTANTEATGARKPHTAAVWVLWNSLVAWMPSTLVDSRLWSWSICSMMLVQVTMPYLLPPLIGDPLPDIPVKLNRFACMQLEDGPLKFRLARIGIVVRRYARVGMLLLLVIRGFRQYTENKAHSTVWQVYSAFVTLVPMAPLARMHFLHAWCRGAVVRLAIPYAPTTVLRWIVKQGAGVNGESPEEPSALASAVFNRNDISVVEMLLDAGANLHASNWCKHTLLGTVLNRKDVDSFDPMIHLLLDAGGDTLIDELPHVIRWLSTGDPHGILTGGPRPRIADMLLGVIAYQAHLAQHAMPMIESTERRLAVSRALEIFRKPELLAHAHGAMRRQAWSRRRRAVVAWHVLAYELE